VQVSVKPLLYSEPDSGLYAVIFEQHEPSPSFIKRKGEDEGERNDSENLKIMELEHELASTKEHLQTFVEELETANEELQSLNEELQSSNEELQSSNEELETSNEELQSTNEELQIAYSQLKAAADEVEIKAKALSISEANAKALLNNKLQAFFLISSDYRIVEHNQTAEEYVKNLFDKPLHTDSSIIDYLLPGELERFQKDFKKSLEGKTVYGETQVPNTMKGSKLICFRYNFTPVINEGNEVTAVTYSLLDTTQQKRIERELSESEELINSIFNAADIGICVTNQDRKFVKVNQAYCDIYGYAMEDVIGKEFTMMLDEEAQKLANELHDDYLDGHEETPGVWEVMRKNGDKIKVRVTASRLINSEGEKFKVTTVAPVSDLPNKLVNKPD